MDYTQLTASSTTAGSIAAWLNHASLVAASPTIVNEAESWVYRRLRHWKMLTSTNGTMTASQTAILVPADFLEDKQLQVTGTNAMTITRKTIQEVVQAFSYDGNGNRVLQQPTIFFNDQSNFQLDSPCDKSYPYTLWYFQQPVSIAVSTTNFITSTYPRMFRCALMAGATEFMKDAGVGSYDRTYWDELAQTEIDMANVESDRSQRSVQAGMMLI